MLDLDLNDIRERNGKLPKWAFPGGYPLFYQTRDGLDICPDCANKADMNEEQAPVRADINWEDPELFCEDCGERIESAYAEDEDEDED